MFQEVYAEFAAKAWGNCTQKEKSEIIIEAEVGLSTQVLAAGLGIADLLPGHAGKTVDWKVSPECPESNPTGMVNDPYALVFMKYGGDIRLAPGTVDFVEDATRKGLQWRGPDKPPAQFRGEWGHNLR
jgi:hypothetical protein